MSVENSHIEIVWGIGLLDEGFTSVPNLLIRNYRKMGIEHGEMGLILNLLTYKHDARDPYPSRESLSNNLACNVRQINKWVKSLKDKQLIRTGRRRNVHTKQWDNTVYSLKPLIDELLKVVGYEPIPVQETFEIEWDDDPQVPQVPMDQYPQVPMDQYPQVPTKIKRSKIKTIKNNEEEEYIVGASRPDFISIFNFFEKQNGKPLITAIQERFIQNLNEYKIEAVMGFSILQEVDDLNYYSIEALDRTFKKGINRIRGSKGIVHFPRWFATTIKNEDFQTRQNEVIKREMEETNRKYGITSEKGKNPAELADSAGFMK